MLVVLSLANTLVSCGVAGRPEPPVDYQDSETPSNSSDSAIKNGYNDSSEIKTDGIRENSTDTAAQSEDKEEKDSGSDLGVFEQIFF